MKKRPLLALFAFLLTSCASTPPGLETASVVDWSSETGTQRLSRSEAKADFFVLANQFESQRNKIVCGPTTIAIVLNGLRIQNKNLPKPQATAGFEKRFEKQLSGGFEPRFERFTQLNVFNKKMNNVKTKAQVYGAPVAGAKDFGFQLRQLKRAFEAHDLSVQIRIADGSLKEETLRQEAVANLRRRGDFVVVNYARKALGQPGGGHISPLGAYDEESDSFLILDVNPNKANWVWVTTKALVRAMATYDTVENRGYLLIKEGPQTSR